MTGKHSEMNGKHHKMHGDLHFNFGENNVTFEKAMPENVKPNASESVSE